MKQQENIHPIFDKMESRDEKEELLRQRGLSVWFPGVLGDGKSAIAVALERRLSQQGIFSRILDGDNIRTGINRGLGFSEEERRENIRRIAEVSKLFTETGIVTLSAFVSPTNELREMAREIIGKEDFVEIFVATPLEECERRDVKGLYAKARRGEIKDFTGITSPFEAPESPALAIDTTNLSVEEAVERVLEIIIPKIKHI